ncbi:DNA replication protein DnaD [Fructobacillus pseudoficulneus]|uniref:DNA replication protein DnaD n=1 Tax=Fructobacillus pseudoficulneus TaxID=220714 RepID=A0A3F3H247_9LACO|nr:DnaD domain protein [Fructobacillus pseudoficulneus]GAP02648.1 DNA replication protein DnaD [Fructobacillus pseudoficulneus]SEH38785.1 DNA replication protein [Fructobacillus pseudoficulneus]
MEQRLQDFLQAGQTSIENDLLIHYRDLGLDNDDLVLFLEVNRLQQQGDQADPAVVARIMKVTEKTVIERLTSLVDRGLMQITGQGRQGESYDFLPLYNRLLEGKGVRPATTVVSVGEKSRREVVRILQGEFGRDLSPLEMQTVSQWFDQDHFDPNMMALAIQEAVANNARSLRYIEAILVNWQRDNLTSPQAVQISKEKRRGVVYQAKGNEASPKGQQPSVPTFKLDDF